MPQTDKKCPQGHMLWKVRNWGDRLWCETCKLHEDMIEKSKPDWEKRVQPIFDKMFADLKHTMMVYLPQEDRNTMEAWDQLRNLEGWVDGALRAKQKQLEEQRNEVKSSND